jgi:ribosomal protein L11 methyltransferase
MTGKVSPRDESSWIAIRVEQSANPQVVIDVLFEAGSLGVQEDGAAIVTHFPPDSDVAAIETAVHDADASAIVTTSLAPRIDWSEWRASVSAHTMGRVTVRPPWLPAIGSEGSGGIDVVIDPAMAFGTGEHATTRGVIRLMQLIPEMPPVVADLGAGSAVLSICAARLGAQRVAAIELDPDAIGNAEENLRANGVASAVRLLEGDAGILLPLVAPIGLVLANIISSVLLQLLPVIRGSLTAGGRAILSGILLDERGMMVDALTRGGWSIVSEDTEDGWWSVLIALPQ